MIKNTSYLNFDKNSYMLRGKLILSLRKYSSRNERNFSWNAQLSTTINIQGKFVLVLCDYKKKFTESEKCFRTIVPPKVLYSNDYRI